MRSFSYAAKRQHRLDSGWARLSVAKAALWVALALSASPCIALDGVDRGEETERSSLRFYDRHSEGWFWYEDPQIVQEPDEDEEADEAEQPEPPPEVAQPEEDRGPEPYSADWLKEELETATRAAITDPTEENVMRYMTLQRIVIAKAHRFSESVREMGLRYPELTEDSRTAQTQVERNLRSDMAQQKRDEILHALSSTTGIWFFHKGGAYAQAQARVLERLVSVYGFTVQEIPVGGATAVSDLFESREDGGLSEALGVTAESRIQLFAVNQNNDVIPFSSGVQAATTLRSNLIYMAGQERWIEREDSLVARQESDLDPIIERLETLRNDPEAMKEGGRIEELFPSYRR